MNIPEKLYRHRPLDDGIFIRELEALKESYLFASIFSSMNDPMEAFHQTGGPQDDLIKLIFRDRSVIIDEIYAKMSNMISNFSLISLTSTYKYFPMWAYYSSNFAGMCLEFSTKKLKIGDLQEEKLRPVLYAKEALPPITFQDLGKNVLEETIFSRITRKRSEWEHEKEWRFITGCIGKKHYLDDALTRVFLGPRINPVHREKICEVLSRRPVEILQGRISGYQMDFDVIKPGTPLKECEKIGERKFNKSDCLYSENDLRVFLGENFEKLIDECNELTNHPNMQKIDSIAISANKKEEIYFHTLYKLRSGREIYHKRYFDKNFEIVE